MDAKGFCLKCPVNCTTCNSQNFCFACKNGYKGESCQDSCSDCEIDSRCDKNTDYCLDRCRRGFSGELCNIRCDLKCTSCDRLKQYECNSCSHDRYGMNCNEVCPPTCFNKTCNDIDALCTKGCVPGHWGKMCNETCLDDCKDKICNITNGECLNGTQDTITRTSLATKWVVALCIILIVASLSSVIFIYYLRRTPTSALPEMGYRCLTEKRRDSEEQAAIQSGTEETLNWKDGNSDSDESESDMDTSHYHDALSELPTSHAYHTGTTS